MENLPVQMVPALKGSSFQVEPMPCFRDSLPTVYPFDFTGIYNRDKFIRMGGFDHAIANPYWQNLDFGFSLPPVGRAHPPFKRVPSFVRRRGPPREYNGRRRVYPLLPQEPRARFFGVTSPRFRLRRSSATRENPARTSSSPGVRFPTRDDGCVSISIGLSATPPRSRPNGSPRYNDRDHPSSTARLDSAAA